MKNKQNKMKILTSDEVDDIVIGKRGTVRRDKLDEKVQAELVRLTIKESRKKQNLTQTQLGKKVGMEKAQVSKIENGVTNTGYLTIVKILNALNINIVFSPTS